VSRMFLCDERIPTALKQSCAAILCAVRHMRRALQISSVMKLCFGMERLARD